MKISLGRPCQDGLAHCDFVSAQIIMVGLTNTLSSIAIISFVVFLTSPRLGVQSEYVDVTHSRLGYFILCVLTGLQLSFFYMSLFMTRGKETSRLLYINYAPEFLFWLFKIALLIMPWIVIVFAIAGFFLSDEDSEVFLPFFVYAIWTELGIFVEGVPLYVPVKGSAHKRALNDRQG